MMEQTITVMSSLILKKNSLKQRFVVCNDGKKNSKEKMSSYQLSYPATRQENKTKRHHD